jgi:hypothetical protein
MSYSKEYRPGTRDFGLLPEALKQSLGTIVPSRDGAIEYRPCVVTLRDGSVHPCVYLLEAQPYISAWGIWPDDDPGKTSVKVRDVISLAESPHRLPQRFANEIYRHRESGMGYTIFTLRFRDMTEQAYVGGNAIDFVPMPLGKATSDIVAVLPHHGRDAGKLELLPYSWCLFGEGASNAVGFRVA